MKYLFTTYHPTLTRALWLSVGLLLGFLTAVKAQTGNNQETIIDSRKETEIIFRLESQPNYPSGFSKMKKYLKKNLTYPPAAVSAHIQGKVFLSFYVEIDGRLTDVTVLKGLGYGCDEEAIRVVRNMPRWKPGSQAGKPVRVRYNLPVHFGTDHSNG